MNLHRVIDSALAEWNIRIQPEIDRAVGPMVYNAAWMREHTRWVRHVGDPFGQETFVVDGVPVFELLPVEQSVVEDGDSYRITFTQRVRRLG